MDLETDTALDKSAAALARALRGANGRGSCSMMGLSKNFSIVRPPP